MAKTKKKRRLEGEDEEPDALGLALQQKRKPKAPRLADDESPSLYHEDLGTEGVKQKKTQSWLSGGNFEIKVTKDEKKRRRERQVRFRGQDGNC
jgi:hypothetical protein